MSTHQPLPRRQLLQTLLSLGAGYAMPGFAQIAMQSGATQEINTRARAQKSSQSEADGRLVVVFLRGAYDGLSALVPYGDANYYRLRPTLAIAAPDGSTQTALKLDNSFGLHPALAPLLPLWQQGVLGVIPCAGSPDATRSHFEAQHHWEIGRPGKASAADGWMNTLAGLRPPTRALGVGEANPQILAGTAPVQLVPSGQAATRTGALGEPLTRDAVLRLYAGEDALSKAFRAGADSRMHTAQTLTAAEATPALPDSLSRQMAAADNGAGPAKGLLLDARHLGTLMRQDRRLRLGFLSAGGWDTHANQGGVTGALAQNLANLAATLVQLRRDFSAPHDVVLVVSEFGRTSAENGTRGTDHGHGNALWLLGDAVQGGRWHGQWQGLASDQLHEGRDLPVHHDFRAVLAQVLRRTQGLNPGELDQLFPGLAWDARLDGLMRG
ncbi:DUF1501 domain-containing protein [Rhodoferax sp.]|uniref:DUF1501 domain-containing protein n=1 Tax=Rhodoferax sp. TaxID=50421 RepID=UPI002603F915|nr:DUF1501 domain-containing protein [Rhodoferax sp.]MDD2925697.1 DUF1501 domain-containing protein [Rhodoferax sp.]